MRGKRRGKKLGFHTANLDNIGLNLNYGIYLTEVKMGGDIYDGLLHFGPQKTFGNKVTAEVYIKDFNSEIYGKRLKVMVVKKIREIKRFKSVDGLVKQIKKDIFFLNLKSKI